MAINLKNNLYCKLLLDAEKMGIMPKSTGKLLNYIFLGILRVYSFIFHPFAYYLIKVLSGCDSIIDIGCGKNSPLRYYKPTYAIGVDIHKPYLKESQGKKIHNNYILGDIRRIDFKPKCVDVVIALSVIEHLSKEHVYQLLHKMEQWAQKKVILYTANGHWPQEPYDDNPYQKHISEWSTDELKALGYKVYGIGGLKKLAEINKANKLINKLANVRFFKIFFKILADISEKMVYTSPNHSKDLFCIKNLRNDDVSSVKSLCQGQ